MTHIRSSGLYSELDSLTQEHHRAALRCSSRPGVRHAPQVPNCIRAWPRRAAAALLALAALLAPGAADAVGPAPVPSFPGAAGFGATTPGGRGGPIVAVTSLADSGPGTLRWALEQVDGPRVVVFAVEGEIALARDIGARGRLSLFGNVAPGAGVVVTGAGLRIEGDDAIVRGMRIRPGDGPGHGKSERDAIGVGARAHPVRRVVIDRNSFAWSTDEVVNTWYGASDVTISNNIVAEGLRDAGHENGRHSMGMLIGDGSTNISIVGNFFINSEFRNPTIAKGTNVEIINNYVYNYGQHALSFTMREGMFTLAHVIGNVFEAGPSTGRQTGVRIDGPVGGGRFHLSDNISRERPDATRPEAALASGRTWRDRVLGGPLEATLSARPLFAPSGVVALPAASVKEHVLATSGARHPRLDAVDARLVGEALNGGGRLIDSPDEVRPTRPDPAAGAGFPPDGDGDFVPDDWERRLGSDPAVADSHLPAPGAPYTVIELYAHALAVGP